MIWHMDLLLTILRFKITMMSRDHVLVAYHLLCNLPMTQTTVIKRYVNQFSICLFFFPIFNLTCTRLSVSADKWEKWVSSEIANRGTRMRYWKQCFHAALLCLSLAPTRFLHNFSWSAFLTSLRLEQAIFNYSVFRKTKYKCYINFCMGISGNLWPSCFPWCNLLPLQNFS